MHINTCTHVAYLRTSTVHLDIGYSQSLFSDGVDCTEYNPLMYEFGDNTSVTTFPSEAAGILLLYYNYYFMLI